MSSHLIDSLATTPALAAEFGDRAVIAGMLEFEVALARVERDLGLVPAPAADAIGRAADPDRFDPESIARAARESGTVAIPFVAALVEAVERVDPAAAGYVHWGVTSQDVVDTAFVLALGRAQKIIDADRRRVAAALRILSDRHAHTVMLGRTLLQPALPITFGLKVAGWYAMAARSWRDVERAAREALVPQIGGAVGTLAAFGGAGLEVMRGVARELGLSEPAAPWHAHRDRIAALASAHGVYVGALGKMARDIALLMQDEVGEALEPGGGSSAMPHKRNPAGSAIVQAAATRVPGLVASLLAGMVQEHERAVGGWHAEWPSVAAVVQASGSATAALADVLEGLQVESHRMGQRVDAMNGAIFAERVALRLAPQIGRARAADLARSAVAASRAEGRPLADVLAGMPEVTQVMRTDEIRNLDRPETYVGVAERLRVRLLAEPDAAGS